MDTVDTTCNKIEDFRMCFIYCLPDNIFFNKSFSCPSFLVLVVALERVERSSGPLIGNSIASIQKNTAPKVYLLYFKFGKSLVTVA